MHSKAYAQNQDDDMRIDMNMIEQASLDMIFQELHNHNMLTITNNSPWKGLELT